MVTAYSYLFRSLGCVISLCLSSAVIQQSLRNRLRDTVKTSTDIEQIIKGVQHSLEFIQTLEPDIQKAVRDCYGWSINLGFTFIIGMASFAFFSAFFVRECNLKR
ncbi:MFS multidrug transporter [Pyrenophora tritici-repentis]|nr:MFS multidrug transporter [Pyrenophora tritici-repentis]KAI0568826.1 MFS multidrug transporter [Pyrenophora tritici-repentis]KAI0568921.1 MFS multidrug transporter [Pyrenophora tritici-repentis]KAI0604275.1 MFS multidrug transporter [Pyrenophora tritici-repentis]KAI0616515.1 MFS multidrug transporter [Pyrenophora tritici-repentis]